MLVHFRRLSTYLVVLKLLPIILANQCKGKYRYNLIRTIITIVIITINLIDLELKICTLQPV